MNTPNNARRRRSREQMIQALLQLLQEKELSAVRVVELCRLAGVNRATFYACFTDIYDLAEAAQKKLEEEVSALYYREADERDHSEVFLQLFRHIAENQLLYKTYFKLGGQSSFGMSETDKRLAEQRYGWKDVDYHVAFFQEGLNAVIKKWLSEGCRKTPEEINEILFSEYHAHRDE